MGGSVLVLTAFQLTRAMGLPSDIVWVEPDTPEGLLALMDRAFVDWGASGRVPAECEVVEVYRLGTDGGWDERVTRVAKLVGGRWLDAWGQPIQNVAVSE